MNRFIQVITEIEDQRSALQSIIDAKKEEILNLQQEIPELESQLAGLNQLFTDAQLLQPIQSGSSANPGYNRYSQSTVV